jgi:hypothetical protein
MPMTGAQLPRIRRGTSTARPVGRESNLLWDRFERGSVVPLEQAIDQDVLALAPYACRCLARAWSDCRVEFLGY